MSKKLCPEGGIRRFSLNVGINWRVAPCPNMLVGEIVDRDTTECLGPGIMHTCSAVRTYRSKRIDRGVECYPLQCNLTEILADDKEVVVPFINSVTPYDTIAFAIYDITGDCLQEPDSESSLPNFLRNLEKGIKNEGSAELDFIKGTETKFQCRVNPREKGEESRWSDLDPPTAVDCYSLKFKCSPFGRDYPCLTIGEESGCVGNGTRYPLSPGSVSFKVGLALSGEGDGGKEERFYCFDPEMIIRSQEGQDFYS